MDIYSSPIQYNDTNFNYNGVRCLVKLKEPILNKDLKEYKYLLGNTVVGYLPERGSWCVKIGKFRYNPNRIITLMDNIVSIQPCEKIIDDERVLVIED